jgi:hypothetical protein
MRWGVYFGVVVCLTVPPQVWGQAGSRSGGDFSSSSASAHPEAKVPSGVILVKGAWASASDSVTPVPEDASVDNGVWRDEYFGMKYALPKGWAEKYKGPPPSDSGRYVLAQLRPPESNGTISGTILITAQDMFFTPLPASNALQLVNYSKDHLQADYRMELPMTQTKLGGRPFVFFAYWSSVAELHWYVLDTEIRCHAVEIVLTSRDTKLLESLVLDLNKMQLPEEADPITGNGGGGAPVCMANYASHANVLTRVEPVFTQRRFNPVPVRIIIDKKGAVKHIHFLSAFPDQSKVITDALKQWKFRPYMRNGQPVEVETGIMFGNALRPAGRQASSSSTE